MIRLYNTKTRRKEEFEPLDPDNVRMYVCGPTVYDRAHLGNARPAIVFDVLFRLLRHVYGPDHVTYVRNFTDVDDKINARAAETGRPIGEITAETTGWYLDDMAAIGVMEPTHMPRATAWIGPMVAMIEDLIAKGHAYEAEGHVLFRVRSYSDYGALSGRSVDDMRAGARVEVAPYKEDPMDFVLWKPSTPDLPGWESPWGRGRPGWHIECSAMAYELLGESFDIHGGGNDLQFPHHENEIAQSKCAHPEGDFARVWMHNEMLQVEGKKMSKSLGNFFTVRDLLDQGVPGEVIRFVMLSTHYRKPMDWTEKKAEEAQELLHNWRLLTEFAEPSQPSSKVIAALADDLNTWEAIEELKKLADRKEAGALKASGNLLGLLYDQLGEWSWKERSVSDLMEVPEWHPASRWLSESLGLVVQKLSQINAPLFELSKQAVKQIEVGRAVEGKIRIFAQQYSNIGKQAAKAILSSSEPPIDAARSLASFYGRLKRDYAAEIDMVEGTIPISKLTIENMNAIRAANIVDKIEKRAAAKKAKQFQEADQIRSNLEDLGIILHDTPDGTKWTLSEAFDPSKLEDLSDE